MTEIKLQEKTGKKYKLVPPEGGWGYIVGISVSLTFIVIIVPLVAFGIIFGEFLASLGDETGATTILNGVYNTVLCFTGLPANHLLQKYSYRTVGLLGATFYSIGACATIFVTSVMQMLVAFGILQGIGFGLMMPAVFCAFNAYFDKKQNVVMAVCQAMIVAVCIVAPAFTKSLMTTFGFRGTLAIFAAFSLNGFVAMGALQPVEWHLKKEEVDDVEMELAVNNQEEKENKDIPELNALIMRKESTDTIESNILQTKMRSIPSLSGFACSLQNIHQDSGKPTTLWGNLSKSLDLALFKDATYVNIACGLSFGMTSDMVFLSIYPLLLASFGFSDTQATTVMTIFFIADLTSRILLCFVSAAVKVRNRYIFLLGALLSAVLRIAFTLNTSFWWIVTVSACLGFLRCFIQTPLPLVVAEQYGPRFPTAFSLYMVVCGVVSLVVGVLSAALKEYTGSNITVVHLLTIIYLLCAIPWIFEVLIVRISKKKSRQ